MVTLAIEKDKEDSSLQSIMAEVCYKLGLHKQALEAAEACIDLNPNWSKGY